MSDWKLFHRQQSQYRRASIIINVRLHSSQSCVVMSIH
jgi:hypothetical protein